MNEFFAAAMRKATQLTRDQNLIEATRVIQRALSGRDREPPENPVRENGRLIELQAEPAPNPSGSEQETDTPYTERKKRPLGEYFRGLGSRERLCLGVY